MPILAFVISIGFLAVVGMTVGMVAVNTGRVANAHGPRTFALMGALCGTMNVLTALLFRARSRESFTAHFALGRATDWRLTAVGFVATISVGQLASTLIASYGVQTHSSVLLELRRFAHEPWPTFALMAVVTCLVAGTTEELLFRGYIQRRVVGRLGVAGGIALTSLLFGIAHFDRVHSPEAGAIGLVMGLTAYAARSTRASMVVHILNNAVALLCARYLTPIFDPLVATAVCVIAAAAAAASLILLTRAASRRHREDRPPAISAVTQLPIPESVPEAVPAMNAAESK